VLVYFVLRYTAVMTVLKIIIAAVNMPSHLPAIATWQEKHKAQSEKEENLHAY